MLTLSIRQPWAWLIVNGHKNVENRNWYTTIRGQFAVHAGKTLDRDGWEWVAFTFPEINMPRLEDMPRGGVVGYSTIIDCVEVMDSPWFFGPYGFVLMNPKPCDLIPCAGRLGWFEVETEQETQRKG